MAHTQLELATIAKRYYMSCIPRNTYGVIKYVATDGDNTMFVNSDYSPAAGDCVYLVRRMYNRGGEDGIYCQLYAPRNRDEQTK